jgi:transcriptional regulator with XRE-family HTH domain
MMRHHCHMADTPPLPRQEAEAIRTRRLELGWTQHRLAHQAGISIATVRKLEAHKQPYYRALTLVPLCLALGWRSDALDNLLPPGSQLGDPPDDTAGDADAGADADAEPGAGAGADAGGSGTTVAADPPGQVDLLAAFDGGLAGLDPDEIDELAEFVRQLRKRRRH